MWPVLLIVFYKLIREIQKIGVRNILPVGPVKLFYIDMVHGFSMKHRTRALSRYTEHLIHCDWIAINVDRKNVHYFP